MTDRDRAPTALVVERVTAASWRTYRDVRLAALIDSPRAFWATYAEAAERTDDEWRERCATAGPTWLALDDGRPVGTVGLWHARRPARRRGRTSSGCGWRPSRAEPTSRPGWSAPR